MFAKYNKIGEMVSIYMYDIYYSPTDTHTHAEKRSLPACIWQGLFWMEGVAIKYPGVFSVCVCESDLLCLMVFLFSYTSYIYIYICMRTYLLCA